MNENPNRAESAIAPSSSATRQVSSTITQLEINSGVLEQLRGLVDWWSIAQEIPERYHGWPAERVVLLKMLYLADCYGLDDQQCVTECRDRLSFRRFLGVALEAEMPNTEDLSRVRLGSEAGLLIERVLGLVNDQLTAAGASVHRLRQVGVSITRPVEPETPARPLKAWVQPKKTHPFSEKEQRPATTSAAPAGEKTRSAISNRNAGVQIVAKDASGEFRPLRNLAAAQPAEPEDPAVTKQKAEEAAKLEAEEAAKARREELAHLRQRLRSMPKIAAIAIVLVALVGGLGYAALKWSRSSASSLPSSEPALKTYISTQIKNNNLSAALEGVKKLEAMQTSGIDVYRFQGMIFSRQKDYAAARQSLEKALAINDDYEPALSALAAVEMVDGQYPKAEEYLKDIKATPPYDPAITFRLYLCALLEKDQDKAAKVLKISPITPQNSEYYYLPVAAALVAGNRDEAIRLRDTARTMVPDDYRRHEELLRELKLL